MIELLSPAGGTPQLKAALRFGADAVYGGLNEYGLRAFASNFTFDELEKAVALTHKARKKFYLTLNIFPHDDELRGLVKAAQTAYGLGVDAAIVSDLGAIAELRRNVPALPLHISTQANVMNAPSARFLAAQGAERVVLARELSLAQIRVIRENTPPALTLEAFVHGAMCMAYSGRCMLSDHLAARGGNRGACAQPCRWHYRVVEEKRPGEIIDVEAEARGTSLFSAFDLCMLKHLPELLESGITSLKIEGRMKTAYYVATVTACYRRALDLLLEKGEAAYRDALPALSGDLTKVGHRAANTGFYFGAPTPPSGADLFVQSMEYVADVLGSRENHRLLLTVKNRFCVGDMVELLTREGSLPFSLTSITDEQTGEELQTVSVAGHRVMIPCPYEAYEGDYLRGPNRNHRASI